jgi:hypothetical protein
MPCPIIVTERFIIVPPRSVLPSAFDTRDWPRTSMAGAVADMGITKVVQSKTRVSFDEIHILSVSYRLYVPARGVLVRVPYPVSAVVADVRIASSIQYQGVAKTGIASGIHYFDIPVNRRSDGSMEHKQGEYGGA